MTNEQKLRGIINKAIHGGWKSPISGLEPEFYFKELIRNRDYLKFIFTKDFAKAYWGEGDIQWKLGKYGKLKGKVWEYHLQLMVLEEDKLKYLEINL